MKEISVYCTSHGPFRSMEIGDQVFRRNSVVLSMKARLLLFCCGMRAEKDLYRSLSESDFTVRRVIGISNLHQTLGSQAFDAVVVSHEFLALRRISPSSHIKAAKSPVSIITWEYLPDGRLTAESFPGQDPEGNSGPVYTRAIINEHICRTIEGTVCGQDEEASDTSPPYLTERLPELNGSPIPDLGVHRKMRFILEAIARTGPEGITPDLLLTETWGPSGESRRNDLHAYISKLRKALLRVYGSRYRILLRKNRYRLLDTAGEPLPERRTQSVRQSGKAGPG